MNITDEWADDFNRVMRDRAARLGKPVEPEPLREDTKAALAAVAPMIAAKALRDAVEADSITILDVFRDKIPAVFVEDLLDRADRIEGGHEGH